METLWTIELLGGLRVLPNDGGEAITRFRTRNAAALLARLAFGLRSQPATRDQLIDILWPYAEPDAALARLAVELSGLRRQLEPEGISRGAVLQADRFTIRLNPASVTTDIDDFEKRLAKARGSESESERLDYLTGAVQRYSGLLLPQIEGDWILPERERLGLRFLSAAGDAVAILQKRGDFAAAAEIARTAAHRERRREDAHVLAMRSEIALGNREAALRRFDQLSQMLREDGETPGPEARHCESDARRLPVSKTVPATPDPAAAIPSRSSRPLGTLALLSTDIEGSTVIGRTLGDDTFSQILEQHHALLREEFARAGGTEFHEAGDGFHVAFSNARDALLCAQACQRALAASPLGQGLPPSPGGGILGPLRVRMAIHVADLRYRDDGVSDGIGGYRGLALHDISRLLSTASGGQIFLSEAAEAILRLDPPDGLRIVDHGKYRVRDAPGPQTIYEVLWDDTSGDNASPKPRAPLVRTPVLPAAVTTFFGREAEISAITRALTGTTRVLTLTGMGGSGKTRLAVETARTLSERFAGAIWFVSLIDIENPERIPDALRAVVAPDAGVIDTWEALHVGLGSDPCLLVLDNWEQFLAAENTAIAAAATLEKLLEKFPGLLCLATSRQRIGISAEQEFFVYPLPVPKLDKQGGDIAEAITASAIACFPGIALFTDRARRARPDFEITERNAASIALLCAKLEGIPLGLELAAAWIRLLTPAEMLTQFEDIRRSRDRSLPERHRSLDAAIEGSYRLLDEDMRQFFCALSIFRGGWTLAAACKVCAQPMTLALLAEMRDRSLVVVEDRGDGSRYYFLETVRTFASARLADSYRSEFTALQRRHIDFYAALAMEANDALQGPEQAAWLSRLTDEHQNIAAALESADQSTRLQMAGQLHRYWMIRGFFVEGRRWLKDAQQAGSDVLPAITAKAINVDGVLALSAGDLDAARSLFTVFADRCRADGNEGGAAAADVNLAIIAKKQGDYSEARAAYESTLETLRRLERWRSLATVLSNLGLVLAFMGELDSAKSRLEESLSIQKDLDDPMLRADTLQNLVYTLTHQHDYAAATWFASECFHAYSTLNDHKGIVHLLPMIATLEIAQENYENAARLCGATDASLRRLGIAQPQTERPQQEARLATIRNHLSVQKTQAAIKDGEGMTMPQIQAAILEVLSP